MEKRLAKVEKFLGGPKFAVMIIIVFSLFMIVGTFAESYHGTDFAGRLIYKNWPFILVQACMLTSVCFAAFLRLPPKRRLYGFYTVHMGLIMVGLGSLITYISGIDGILFLPPNEPARKVLLGDDVLKIFQDGGQKYLSYKLPYTAFEKHLGLHRQYFSLGRYLPFAKKTFSWDRPTREYAQGVSVHSSEYALGNGNISQRFFLSLHPEQDEFKSSLKLGPLGINYLPRGLFPCFSRPSTSGYIIWSGLKDQCFTPEERGLTIMETKSGKRFVVHHDGGEPITFFPDLSPWPTNEQGQSVPGGSWRAFSKNLFQETPTLFLFGRSLAYYEDEKWVSKTFEDDTPIELPWMGFTIGLLRHSDTEVPSPVPEAVLPIQKNNELILGNLRALEIIAADRSFWVTNEKPLTLLIDGRRFTFVLDKETLTLPYEIVLSRFQMDKDPGTNNPASYESFVSLFTDQGPQDAHISMNNPLIHEGLTFYQASYSQNQNGTYSSTLSVNMDQGRILKYLGSLFVVLGSLIHYLLNRKVKRRRHRQLVGFDKGLL